MIQKTCEYRFCDNEVNRPRLKYCCDKCMYQEAGQRGKGYHIGHKAVLTRGDGLINNPRVDKFEKPFDKPNEFMDSYRWAMTGANSSYKAMMEVSKMFS